MMIGAGRGERLRLFEIFIFILFYFLFFLGGGGGGVWSSERMGTLREFLDCNGRYFTMEKVCAGQSLGLALSCIYDIEKRLHILCMMVKN